MSSRCRLDGRPRNARGELSSAHGFRSRSTPDGAGKPPTGLTPALRRRLLFLVLLSAATGCLGDGVRIQAKAWLAQRLLEHSWRAARSGREVKPWPWADTWAIGRLEVPRLGARLLVLEHASGRNLAFGPTHVAPSARPGESAHVVLSGHRDTHFRFLPELQAGDWLRLQGVRGTPRDYRVIGTEILHVEVDRLQLHPEEDRLSLVTCYPFDAIVPGGPLRYVVHAVPVVRLDPTIRKLLIGRQAHSSKQLFH